MSQHPQSTYRLQLHPGFDLNAVAEVADYLADLGVSHAYTSPLLQAAPGSTHGYDVVDHSRVSDELGGEVARQALATRLEELGLGCVVDIVPNHMSVEEPRLNRWWWDILTHGAGAEHADYFDIDWSRGRLLLPVLGDGPDELDRLAVVDDQLAYYEHHFPIAPGTVGGSPREVHDRQHYELASWRRGNTELNYRRFFDITSLAGLRMEDAGVFVDTHREILRWVAAGDVDGLRIDHPDGLADPEGYLTALADAAAGCWVVVEKILEPGEDLPASWQCAGTTGYDALRHITALLVDPAGEAPMTRIYADLTGGSTDFPDLAHELKLRAATTNLAAETQRLARLVPSVPSAFDAVAEVMAGFGVYRSYLPEAGSQYLAAAVHAAASRRPDLAPSIAAVDEAARTTGSEFAVRLQQTTGMVMAKGVEDTAFYRYHRLDALNEVGGDPTLFGAPVEDFHTASAALNRDWPHSMTALSTHDTKRSEDVRARLIVLAEMPEAWGAAAGRWSARRPGPDAGITYLAWQTLVGAWPLPHDRALAYLTKAAREAKQHTSWTDPDPTYDSALTDFVGAVYADADLLADIAAFAERLTPFGWSNSLAQKLIQLTMPGVPDVYQGSELWELSLVDPDNRRPVDYSVRRKLLARLATAGCPPVDDSGAAKLHVVSQALRLRREHPGAFDGAYTSMSPEGRAGRHAIAFLRGDTVITVATRLPVGLDALDGWPGTTLALPSGTWTDRLTGAAFAGDAPLDQLLVSLPVALLVRG